MKKPKYEIWTNRMTNRLSVTYGGTTILDDMPAWFLRTSPRSTGNPQSVDWPLLEAIIAKHGCTVVDKKTGEKFGIGGRYRGGE